MIVVLRQVGSFSVFETTYFLGAFITSPNGSPGCMGSNAGVSNVGAPAEQEGVDVLHEAEEGGADVVVPVGAGPAAVGEAAIGVFVFAAGRLHDAVQGDEFVYDELSHGRIPRVRGL